MTKPAAAHIWLNGRLLPSDAAHVSVYDRGFQVGDGVFEALRARRGIAIELAGHLARLHSCLSGMGFELPFGDEVVARGIAELLAAEGMDGVGPLETEAPAGQPDRSGNAVIRITVSRGCDPERGVAPSTGGTATVAIQVWPFSPPSARTLTEGRRFIVSEIRRAPDSPVASVKSTSRAEFVYARIEAKRAGADDAIFVTTDGLVTEATTSNVLAIHGDECATPPLGGALLAGTTRAWLVEHGGSVGLRMVERDLRVADLLDADELAVCAAISGVLPITSLEGRPIGDAKPGPRMLALREAREAWIERISIEATRAAR